MIQSEHKDDTLTLHIPDQLPEYAIRFYCPHCHRRKHRLKGHFERLMPVAVWKHEQCIYCKATYKYNILGQCRLVGRPI